MKIPAKPPDASAIYGAMLLRAISAGPLPPAAQPVDEQGRYLHWDEFRFKASQDPAPAEERWAAMWHARRALATETPFVDKSGKAFWFAKIGVIERALHRIDSRVHGGVVRDGPGPTPADAQNYLVTSLYEEPFSSSLIEGAVATRDQAKKILREARKPRTQGERMILNNHRAIEFIKRRTSDPLTAPLLCELQRILTEDTLDDPRKAGVFRDDGDRIVVEDSRSGEILHDPPAAAFLSRRLATLCAFANDSSETGPFIHPIVRAIILHFMLAYDHPFVDGNGRSARALFYWSVLKDRYWLLEYVSISMQIKEAPIQYGNAFLKTETDGADLTYFILNQLEMIEKSIGALYLYLDAKKRELDALDAALNAPLSRDRFSHRQLALINRAARAADLVFTIAEHEKVSGVSYLTARADLEGLVAAGLFAKSKRGKMSIYRPASGLLRKLGAS